MRRLLLTLLALAALLVAALGLAWWHRLALGQSALDLLMRRAAVPGAAATLARIEPDALRLRNVRVGSEPIFQAEELVFELPWRKLRALRAAAVTVRAAELRIHLDDERLSLGSLEPWLASSASEPGAGPPPIPVDRVSLEQLTVTVEGDLAPLRIGVDGELRIVAADRVEAALELVADRGGSRVAGRLDAAAVYRDAGWQGSGELLIPETSIDSAWLSLAPGIQDLVHGIRGRAAARLDFELGTHGALGRADLALTDIDLRTPWGRLEGIHGTLRVEGPEPLSTPPGQLLAIRRIDVGLPLMDGLIEFQLSPDGAIDVRRATWRWAGGTLRAAATWQPDAEINQATLHVEELELGTLLEQVRLEGLSGSGKLAGFVPLIQEGDRIRIEGGRLAATGPGRIRLAPGAALGAAARQRGELALVFDVLEDFHFEELSVDVNGDTRGDLDLGVHLKGRNPNFEGGRSVEFNLNLEARLADLVRTGLTAYRLPERVQERLDSFPAVQEDSP